MVPSFPGVQVVASVFAVVKLTTAGAVIVTVDAEDKQLFPSFTTTG